MTEHFLEDPFFKQKLNPFFLKELHQYWHAFSQEDLQHELGKAKKNLLRFAFKRLFQPIYLSYQPKISGPIYFLSRIFADGWGDYFALLKSAKILKESHPSLDVNVVYTYQYNIPHVDLKDYLLEEDHIFPFFEKSPPFFHLLESILEGKNSHHFDLELAELQKEKQLQKQDYEAIVAKQGRPIEALEEFLDDLEEKIQQVKLLIDAKNSAENLYQKMQESLAIVHIALAINTFENPALAHKSFYFSETGNFQGIANLLQLNWFSMGLLPFEEGVFLKKSLPESSKTPWKDLRLPHFLFGTVQPTSAHISNYFSNNTLHLGYLPKIPHQEKIFIYLICLQQKKESGGIDIILPSQRKNECLKLDADAGWLTDLGISKVVSVDINTGEEKTIFEKSLPFEKKLRLIHILPIPSHDFSKILEMSGEVVGCTGDISISECLLAKKIPFYELRKHKVETTESFQRLAQHLGLENIYDYFTEITNFQKKPAEIVATNLHNILQQPSFNNQWNELLRFINQYYCFEDALLSHLNRHFFHHLNPALKNEEELLIQNYYEGKISASQAYQTLEESLRKNAK